MKYKSYFIYIIYILCVMNFIYKFDGAVEYTDCFSTEE